VAERLDRLRPDAVHIATEGPLGWAARRWCLRSGAAFTTSFHTHFPQYLALRTRLPADLFWPAVRRFHAPAAAVFAATATLEAELRSRGLVRTHRWSRGVDLGQFSPAGPRHPAMAGLPDPILLYVGRVAVEKNIGAFLALPGPGSKVVVGDGPARAALAARHPAALWLGTQQGAALAAAYRSADVLVFPSLTDTFGLVMVEALASGVPVAAFPVAGPRDVIGDSGAGALDADLGRAVTRALAISRPTCRAAAQAFDWVRCTEQFLSGLAPATPVARAA
jgi:glycosyltransferase involved in cell wall biosynthesis